MLKMVDDYFIFSSSLCKRYEKFSTEVIKQKLKILFVVEHTGSHIISYSICWAFEFACEKHHA